MEVCRNGGQKIKPYICNNKIIINMRTVLNLFFSGILITACQSVSNNDEWVDKALDVASCQLKLTANELKDSTVMPRSLWTGYDVAFWKVSWNVMLLLLQIHYGQIHQKKNWEQGVIAVYTIGQVDSFLVVYGMPTN